MSGAGSRVLVLVAVGLAAGGALADPRRDLDGLTVSLKGAYALPFGKFEAPEKALWLYDVYAAVIPLSLELSYRLPNDVSVGAYAQHAFAQLKFQCPEGLRCPAGSDRLGALATVHFPNGSGWTPWVGGGAGYEVTRYGLFRSDGVGGELTYRGFDVSLSGGGDRHLTDWLSAGIFASLSMGQFLNVAVDSGEPAQIPERGYHFWFSLGARLAVRTFSLRSPRPRDVPPPPKPELPRLFDYDIAQQDLAAARAALSVGNAPVAQSKAQHAVELAERSLDALENPGSLLYPRHERYQTLNDGVLERTELPAQWRALRQRANQLIDSLYERKPDAGTPDAG